MSADNNYSSVAVPLAARRSVWSLTSVMFGLIFFSISMWAGEKLSSGLSFSDFFVTVVAGNLLLGIYSAILAYIAATTGLSTHLLARYSFGIKGSWLASFLLGSTQVGWFGVAVAMFALPVEKATGIDANTLIIILGFAAIASAYFGFSGLTLVSMIASPAIILFGGYSVLKIITDFGGIKQLTYILPDNPLSYSQALSLVVGSMISIGTLTPDVIRFAKNAKNAVLITLLIFVLGNSLMCIFGGVSGIITGQADFSQIMMVQGLLISGVMILGLNIWTTNDTALYSSGLSFSNITGLPSQHLSVFNGIVGTLFSLWIYNNFTSCLVFLSSAIPPVGGILIADYFKNKKSYRNFAKAKFKTINWAAIAAVVIGFLAGRTLPGIIPLNSVFAAAISYLFLDQYIANKSAQLAKARKRKAKRQEKLQASIGKKDK